VKAFLARLYRATPVSLVQVLLRLLNAKFNVGVAGVFFSADGKVLVLHHVYRHTYPWGLPSGFLNAGESSEQGVLRELKEETGLDGSIERILGIQLVRPHHMEVVLAGRIKDAAPPRLCHEIFEAVFMSPDALPPDMPPGQKEFVRQALVPQP